MIYDGLSAFGLYRGLSKGLDVLIDWLEHNDPAEVGPIKKICFKVIGDQFWDEV